jgi:hypothetical protein
MLRPLREQGKRAKEIVATSYYYYYHVSIIKKEVGLKTYRRYRKKSGGKACHRVSISMVCRQALPREQDLTALIMTRPQTLKAAMPEKPVVHVSRAG